MNMFTSYFGNMDNIPLDYICISIAKEKPKYITKEYLAFLPKYNTVKSYSLLHDKDAFILDYNHTVLSRLDPFQVVNDLASMTKNADNIVLLGEEPPNVFSYRKLIATWFRKFGYSIQEL